MCDEDEGDALLGGDAAEERDDLGGASGVEADERLVEDDDALLLREHLRERGARTSAAQLARHLAAVGGGSARRR